MIRKILKFDKRLNKSHKTMILIPIILIAIAAYFIYDMVLLIREKKNSR